MITVEDLREERRKLEEEVAELAPKQKRLALIIELLKLFEPQTEEQAKPFIEMSVSAAILKYLGGCPDYFATPVQIEAALRGGGIVSTAEDFAAIIRVQCSRLIQKGKIRRAIKNSRGGFMKVVAIDVAYHSLPGEA